MRSGLQHRHYVEIAGIIAELDDGDIRQHVAEHFARRLRGSNPSYSEDRFLAAAIGSPLTRKDKAA